MCTIRYGDFFQETLLMCLRKIWLATINVLVIHNCKNRCLLMRTLLIQSDAFKFIIFSIFLGKDTISTTKHVEEIFLILVILRKPDRIHRSLIRGFRHRVVVPGLQPCSLPGVPVRQLCRSWLYSPVMDLWIRLLTPPTRPLSAQTTYILIFYHN